MIDENIYGSRGRTAASNALRREESSDRPGAGQSVQVEKTERRGHC